MDPTHRKIELQSPADLSFLTTQLRTAARAKLDLHLPSVTSDSEPDELRKNVELLVEQFVASIVSGMKSNISINGMDVVQSVRAGEDEDAMQGIEAVQGVVEEEEFEVYDEKLRAKLASTIQKRNNLIAKISAQRRTVALNSAEKWKEQFERENEALAVEHSNMIEGVRKAEGEDLNVDIVRQEEVSRNWERAVQGLERLNKGLPETRARLERCGDVVGYLGAEERK